MKVNEQVQKMIRNDSGRLYKIEFELDGNKGTEFLCPYDAKHFIFDIEFNGGKIISKSVYRN
jgi:hypothetical protein